MTRKQRDSTEQINTKLIELFLRKNFSNLIENLANRSIFPLNKIAT